jgi:hypothetical protein
MSTTNANAQKPVKTATAPAKSSKKDVKLEKVNMAKAAKAVEESHEHGSIYIYPDNVKTPLEKKAFRRNARKQRDAFQKSIQELTASTEKKAKSELAAVVKEQKTWIDATYFQEAK